MKKVITYVIIAIVIVILGVVLFSRTEKKPTYIPIPTMNPTPTPDTNVPVYPNNDGKE